MGIDLPTWQAADARIKRAQIPDRRALCDRVSLDVARELSPREALALQYEPAWYLRARQLPPADADWLVWLMMMGRGAGKTHAAASWMAQQVRRPGDYALVAPVTQDCWDLQWEALKALLPPWVRYVERYTRGQVIFPDHGARLLVHSAECTQYRGPNLRAAWCEEPVKWSNGGELWSNLRLALRVRGETPSRAVFTTTPPRELNWILELAVAPTTRVTRGTMRDNPALDPRNVEAAYAQMAGTIESARELDGEVVLGVDGALFKLEDLERYRVAVAPTLEQVVIAVDPAQSNKRDADPVGMVAAGIARGEIYVLESCSERLEPLAWASRAVEWAARHNAGRYIVEYTGSGSYPRDTLNAQIRISGAHQRPIVDSRAKGSKGDRAQPLSAAAAQGRLHIVGRHEALERELTTWHPGANFSPGGLDALVHAASVLTNNWRAI